MTVSDLPAYSTGAREFIRKTRDPEFRSYLRQIGWEPGGDVVIALDDESIASLVSRLAFNEVGSPCLIALPRAEERFGFRLMFMETVRRPKWRRRSPGEPVSPRSTVGMLYSSLTRCDAYMPSEWVGEMTFSKVPEPA